MNACPYSRTWQDSGQEIGMLSSMMQEKRENLGTNWWRKSRTLLKQTQLLRILFLCFMMSFISFTHDTSSEGVVLGVKKIFLDDGHSFDYIIV